MVSSILPDDLTEMGVKLRPMGRLFFILAFIAIVSMIFIALVLCGNLFSSWLLAVALVFCLAALAPRWNYVLLNTDGIGSNFLGYKQFINWCDVEKITILPASYYMFLVVTLRSGRQIALARSLNTNLFLNDDVNLERKLNLYKLKYG